MRLSEYLALDHGHCDGLLAAFEESVRKSDRKGVAASLDTFIQAMERHFRIEEQDVFPALVNANPMWGPPTQVMRHEHNEMRGLFDELRQAAADGDDQTLLGIAETLVFTIQIHNAKEENVIYQRIDEQLGPLSDELMQSLEPDSTP